VGIPMKRAADLLPLVWLEFKQLWQEGWIGAL
jgi:hypothetical protein